MHTHARGGTLWQNETNTTRGLEKKNPLLVFFSLPLVPRDVRHVARPAVGPRPRHLHGGGDGHGGWAR